MSDGIAKLRALLGEGRPLVMGAFNVTPDSFHDGGRYTDFDDAVAQARTLVDDGADILDIGGESTRPGAVDVPLEEERRRVLPLLERVLAEFDVPVSVDTSKPELMREALEAGAAMINDVRALRADGAFEAVASGDAFLCVMHMQGEPRTMQQAPHYDDVVTEVGDFLAERVDACTAAGIDPARLVVDPGFGFGKTLAHNLTLLRHLDQVVARFGQPLLVGMSRKRMIGQVLDDAPTDERLFGSLAVAVMAVERGTRIVRAHDVRATRDALALAGAVAEAGRAA